MAIDVGTVMDSLGARLATIPGLNVFDYPPKSAQPPFAFLDVPDALDFDLTYGRGQDRMTLQIWVAVSSQVDREARDAIAAYAAGSGAQSIKAAVEAGTVGTSVRVTRVEFDNLAVASGTYFGAVFSVDVQA